MGSSPRVWGQVHVLHDNIIHCGIIPTRVGTSNFVLNVVQVRQDHPHACGDKLLFQILLLFRLGSSPRVWGQEYNDRNGNLDNRIIPTRVGTSSGI